MYSNIYGINCKLLCNFLWVVLVCICCVQSTLTPKSPKGDRVKAKPEKLKTGPINSTVFDNNLVIETPNPKDILTWNQAYYKDTSVYRFKNLVLGYVTPWNNHGYDVAKIFANKFTHISPVWLQVGKEGVENYVITGTHDVDSGWMDDVRKAGKNRGTKIVPRILFDGWSGQDFVSLLSKSSGKTALAETFVDTCKDWRFDGLVVEIWSQLTGRVKNDMLVDLIRQIGIAMKKEKLDLILVVPPKRGNEIPFTESQYDSLYNYVTGFSLMTYDFSNPHRPGPNAPLTWVEECIKSLDSEGIQRDKILTGLNFYGNAYTPTGGGPIIGSEYINKLKLLKGKLNYDPNSVENFFEIKMSNGKQVVFYPTLFSVYKRILLAQEMETGLSIWELGQGLDYFYDLL
ncbi:chitinase-domain containing protein [Rhyzopertha dominica]|nr:chitinase-domain containing protein [Rhyzopertha dominica]